MIAWLAAVAAAAAAVSAARPATATRATALRTEPAPGADVLAALGAAVRRRCDPQAAAPDPTTARRTGAALLVALVVLPLAPHLLVGLVTWQMLAPRLRRFRLRRRAAADIATSLPDLLDLLRLATGAGVPVAAALPAVADRCPGSLATALDRAQTQVDAGRGRADALLEALAPLGEGPAALAHALADHLRYGVPLAPALDRLAVEARLARRHAAEEAARRVPVRLLLPLVLCVLPAFGLLTVVPLLAGSLRSFAG